LPKDFFDSISGWTAVNTTVHPLIVLIELFT
jgi:hypothetical protein